MVPPPVILESNPDFLVVAKPPDLLSHPTRPDGAPSLLGWLQEKFPGEFIALANRLDRETSGTVLAARSPAAASRLGAMTMRREINKYYLALVRGRVTEEHGIVDAPLGRLGLSPENPIWLKRGVIPPDDPQGRNRPRPARNSSSWRPGKQYRSCGSRLTPGGCISCGSISLPSAIRWSEIRFTGPSRSST